MYGLTCGELALLLNGNVCWARVHAPVKVPVQPYGSSHGRVEKRYVLRPNRIAMDCFFTSYSAGHNVIFLPLSGIAGDLAGISIGLGIRCLSNCLLPWKRNGSGTTGSQFKRSGLTGALFQTHLFQAFLQQGAGDHTGRSTGTPDRPGRCTTDRCDFYVMQEMHKLNPEMVFNLNRITKVTGSPFITEKFSERYMFEDIKEYWYKDAEAFRELSARYYLY